MTSNSKTVALQRDFAARWAGLQTQRATLDEAEWAAAYLELMFDTDQAYRILYVHFVDSDDDEARDELGPLVRTVDQTNQARLKSLIETMGWPRLSTHGRETCWHAWMLALHADGDVPFQTEVLALMRPLIEEAEVDPICFAALSDRIAIHEDRPQRWGMFYRLVDGERVFLPIEDPEGLPARRAELGLDDTRFRFG